MGPEAEEPRGLPPLPEPFPERPSGPSPRPPRDPARLRRGCLIAGLAGLGLAVVVLVAVLAVVAVQGDRIVAWALDPVRVQVVEALPEEVTSEERNRLDRAFDSVIERFRTRAATPADSRRLQIALTDAVRRMQQGRFDRDALLRLTERRERIAAPGPEN